MLSDDVDASYREAALGNGKELDVFMQLCRKLGGVQQHDAVEAWECLADALQFEHIQLVEHTWVDGVQSKKLWKRMYCMWINSKRSRFVSWTVNSKLL